MRLYMYIYIYPSSSPSSTEMEIKLAESDSRVGISGAEPQCEYRLFETTGTYSRCAISAKCGWPRFSLRYTRGIATIVIGQLEKL